MKASYRPEIFIDRKNEIDLLFNLSSTRPEGHKLITKERVVHLIGKSRIGKSWLLHRYFDILSSDAEGFYPIYINLENYTSFPPEDFIIALLKFVDARIVGELNVSSPFINGVRVEVDSYQTWIFRCIEQIQQHKVVVLMLDEVNKLTLEQAASLEDYFLEACLELPNTMVILSGRHAISRWKTFDLRPVREVNVIELSGFDLENTQKQIEKTNRQAVSLAPRIQEIGGGSPGNTKEILNHIADNPLGIIETDALHACNKELYDELALVSQGLPEKNARELLPALQALCVLQDFDREYEMPIMLAAHDSLDGDWDVGRSAALLDSLFRIQVGPSKLIDWDRVKNGYAMEEQFRFNLEQELKLGNPELWKTLHRTAMKMYEQWANEYPELVVAEEHSNYHKSRLA